MSSYTFQAFGHPNIRATHATTLEFTRDVSVSLRGDCIVGVNADFKIRELQRLLGAGHIALTIAVGGLQEKFTAIPNKEFAGSQELVIRTTAFVSARTFAILSEKAAKDINRKLIDCCKTPNAKITVTLSSQH